MNGKKAKKLRQLARAEMAGSPDWDWVAHPKIGTTAINAPDTVRAMYRALKERDKEVARTGARVDASNF